MARMKILNSHEAAAFDSPPKFDSAERKRFFSISQTINGLLETLRTPTNQVCFLILVGYFRAKRKFFRRQFYPADIVFVAHQLSVKPEDVHVEHYSKLQCHHSTENNNCLTTVQTLEFLLSSAFALQSTERIWQNSKVAVYPKIP